MLFYGTVNLRENRSAQAQLDRASSTIGDTDTRTRVMQRKLKDVEELPTEESTKILGFDSEKNSGDEEN